MYCTKCGTPNEDMAIACVQCGTPLPKPGQMTSIPAPTPKISSYLILGIFVNLCCCVPFGIVAVYYAAQVDTKLHFGDIAGAEDCSKKALLWSSIGFILGIISMIGYLVYALMAFKGMIPGARF